MTCTLLCNHEKIYNVKTPWVKCYGNEDFEAFMGCYDRTEV